MAEYIERGALKEVVVNLQFSKHLNKDAALTLMYKAVNNLPAADVAPVVRCRDCKHAWIHPCGYVLRHRDGRSSYEMTFGLDSFCSYGERSVCDG